MVKLFMTPCKYPAANKSPAPVRSIILRFFSAEHSTISPLFSAMAPFSPLVITKFLFKYLIKVIASSNDLAPIKDNISCSLAKIISSLFLN